MKNIFLVKFFLFIRYKFVHEKDDIFDGEQSAKYVAKNWPYSVLRIILQVNIQ